MNIQKKLEERLIKTIAKTSINYSALQPNDKILVAVSGGKDSYCLLYLLNKLRARMPFQIELYAVHVSQGQPGFDPTPLRDWLQNFSVPFEITEQDTYSVVKRNIDDGGTACSICARMRRGILYTRAQKNGCNKIALGHHREDTLATVMMNMFYSGKIQAMPPMYTTDDGRFKVVRPMIEIAESDLARLARIIDFPIIPREFCDRWKNHKRKKINELLDMLEKDSPKIKQVMLGSLKNIRPTHLLDQKLRRVE